MQKRFSHAAIRLGAMIGVIALLAVIALPMSAFAQRSRARISAARARQIALTAHPGKVVSTRLTTRSGRGVYDVYIRSGQVRRHVLVNARTGDLVVTQKGPTTRNPRRIALTAHPGKIVDGPKRMRYQGKSVHWVTVQSGVVRRTVLINARTGDIVKTMTRHTDM